MAGQARRAEMWLDQECSSVHDAQILPRTPQKGPYPTLTRFCHPERADKPEAEVSLWKGKFRVRSLPAARSITF